MNNELIKKFQIEMMDTYLTAKKETGHNHARFLQMITDPNIGGYKAAKQLIPEMSDGFTTLWGNGRLDLTVEACVLKPEYAELFTSEEKEICRIRLTECGYKIPE